MTGGLHVIITDCVFCNVLASVFIVGTMDDNLNLVFARLL